MDNLLDFEFSEQEICDNLIKFCKELEKMNKEDEWRSRVLDEWELHYPKNLTQKICNEAVEVDPWILEDIPEQFKTQKMCDKAMEENPLFLAEYVPEQFKTKKMYDKIMEELVKYSGEFERIPDYFKTQEMCDKVVEKDSYNLQLISDKFLTRDMCDKALEDNLWNLQFVPDYFNSENLCCKAIDKKVSDKRVLDSINEYKKRKAQKRQIKYELLPIAWHPDRVYDWCFDEEEKGFLEEMWGNCDD